MFFEKIITYQDGHGTQDERSKQVGVDVVAGTMQFPTIGMHKITIKGKKTELQPIIKNYNVNQFSQ